MKHFSTTTLLFFLPLFAQQLPAQSPQITNGGIVNAASYARPTVFAPGLVFSLFGTSFTDGTSASAAGVPLPTRLAGTRVLVNGVAAPLFAVSPVQIDAQFPVELSDVSSATIQVEVQSTTGVIISPAITVDVAPVSPGIFTLNAIGSGLASIVRTSDGNQICPQGRSDCPANPAIPGEVVSVYMTGLGAVNGPWFSGQPATTMFSTVTTPAVTIGGTQAHVLFSGLSTSSVGVYKVDVAVPGNVPAGDSVAVIASIGGKTSNQATIAIGTATPAAQRAGGPPGGSITTIAIDPLNHYTLYAVTQSRVIKSTNGGASWIPAGSGLPASFTIRFLTIDAHNSRTIYAAGNSVFKSTDGAATWTAINRGLNPSLTVTGLAIDPVNPSTLYVATINPTALSAGTNPGPFLFKSTDGGEHWTALTRGLPTKFVNALVAIDPTDSAVLYTAGETAVGQRCIFESINTGTSWSLTGCTDPSTFLQDLQDLIVDPNHTGTLYGRSVLGIFKSVDKGRSWSALNIRQTVDISSLVMSPVSPSTLYFATRTGLVFKSIDGGENWTAGASVSSDAKLDISSVVVDPINPATLYAATVRGVFRSVDGGANWSESSNGITGTFVSALALDRHSPANLYVGTRSGAFKSIDGGATWSAISSGLAIFVRTFVFDPANLAIAYAGIGGSADNDGVYKSTDGGASWTAIWNGRSHGAHALAINPLNTAVLFVVTGSSGALKSADAGATWTRMSDFGDVNGFVFDPINPAIVYAAGSGLLKSTDAGTSWTMIADSLPQGCCSSVIVDPSSTTTIYALGTGIFKSTDGGASWSVLNTDFLGGNPPIRPTTLVVDPASPITLYAGTNHGIFKSTDAGTSWSAASDGLTNLNISTLLIDSSSPSKSSTLFAGTNGAGVFRSTDGGTTWQPTSANLN